MNGKNFDLLFDKYRELKGLLHVDVEAYCISVNSLQSISDYNKFLYSREIATLDEKIHENTYDSEAIQAAKYLYSANYKNLEEQFSIKRNGYEHKVQKEMDNYKNVAKWCIR